MAWVPASSSARRFHSPLSELKNSEEPCTGNRAARVPSAGGVSPMGCVPISERGDDVQLVEIPAPLDPVLGIPLGPQLGVFGLHHGPERVVRIARAG